MSTLDNPQGQCPLCQRLNQVLLRSHLIPDSFTATLTQKDGKQQKAFLLDRRGGERRARPGGIYQEHFLCGCCEQRLGIWDDYAGGVFFREVDSWRPLYNPAVWTPDHGEPNELHGWQRDDVDADQVLRFFYSFLWRLHATDRAEFAGINLGEHAELFRGASLSGILPVPPLLEITLVRWERSQRLPGIEAAPSFSVAGQAEGRRAYDFDFGGWRAHLEVDAKPFPSEIQQRVVQSGSPLLAMSLKFDGSRADQQLRLAAREISRAESEREVGKASARLERMIKKP